ncbi:hypothetical protein M153_62600001234, partial [Pseudoloma neurophilia]
DFPKFPHNQKLIAHLLKFNHNFKDILKSNELELIFKVITGLNNMELEKIPRNILEYLIEINIKDYLIVKDQFMTGYFYEKTDKFLKSQGKKNEKPEKINEITKMSKMDKKEEKIRKKLEKNRLIDEGELSEEMRKAQELKICNGILKLFLLILKTASEEEIKKVEHLLDLVFIGLRKLQPIVKDDLLSGIKLMTFSIIQKKVNYITRFHAILAILTLFEKKSIDMKGIRDLTLVVLADISKNITDITNNNQDFFKLLNKAIRSLLLVQMLPSKEVTPFLNYLMLLCSLTYSPLISGLILELKEFYEIDQTNDENSFVESVYRKMYYLK